VTINIKILKRFFHTTQISNDLGFVCKRIWHFYYFLKNIFLEEIYAQSKNISFSKEFDCNWHHFIDFAIRKETLNFSKKYFRIEIYFGKTLLDFFCR